ncbi:DUF4275 family protein [Aneurinibacillus sp. BA2021]|nr:DUF4275 family protein [Aneurinibacillus sp. BA2021]
MGEENYIFDDNGCCGFLWHIFSYEKKSCFKKEEANKEFNWTYVRTHETEWCGPYFSRRD